MEKELLPSNSGRRVLITGPESTGKTELSLSLADHFRGISVPEYAREYIEGLEKPYEFIDIEHIARWQIREYDSIKHTKEWVFFDTWLIITKVWFDVRYGRIPKWVNRSIKRANFDLVLLCAPDIPWVADQVREHGGESREMLFDRYKNELDAFDMNWKVVTGNGEDRFSNALQLINSNIRYGAT